MRANSTSQIELARMAGSYRLHRSDQVQSAHWVTICARLVCIGVLHPRPWMLF